MPNKLKAAVLILAAGKSKRFKKDKQFTLLLGKEIIKITVENFLKFSIFEKIILAVSKDNFVKAQKMFSDPKIKVVIGGKNRMESLRKAFFALEDGFSSVCVHDGARPFLSRDLTEKLIFAALKYNASVPVVPLKDTVKMVKKGFVSKTIDRSRHFSVQTPQCYKYEILKKMLNHKSSFSDLTDESQILDKMKVKVFAVLGEYENIKITTPEDIYFAEAFYAKKNKK